MKYSQKSYCNYMYMHTGGKATGSKSFFVAYTVSLCITSKFDNHTKITNLHFDRNAQAHAVTYTIFWVLNGHMATN